MAPDKSCPTCLCVLGKEKHRHNCPNSGMGTNDALRMMIAKKNHKCPRCLGPIPDEAHVGEYPGALSRHDNKTEICSACGMLEAFEDFMGPKYTGPIYWEKK